MSKITIQPINHIFIAGDESYLKARILGKGFKVRILAEWMVHGNTTVEEMIEGYDMTRGQIYAALSYYYDHQEAFDAEIARLDQMMEEAMANHVPTRLELLIEERRKEREAKGE
jgi:uncharacterized protein (DUF433 family)